MKQAIPAIIFDLDGTVMPSARHSMPGPEICAAVTTNRDKLILCAATGRAWRDAGPVIKALGVNRPSIINGGTSIVDPESETILWEETIPAKTAAGIYKIAKKYPYPFSFSKGLTIVEGEEPKGSVNTLYILDVPLNSPNLKLLEDELDNVEGVTISRAYSWGIEKGMDLHITSQTATKEHAVVELCSILNLDRTKVAGVGDGFNDIHLFNAVGYKVAMGNAVSELKEAADEVIAGVEENGLAAFIKQVAGE